MNITFIGYLLMSGIRVPRMLGPVGAFCIPGPLGPWKIKVFARTVIKNEGFGAPVLELGGPQTP